MYVYYAHPWSSYPPPPHQQDHQPYLPQKQHPSSRDHQHQHPYQGHQYPYQGHQYQYQYQ